MALQVAFVARLVTAEVARELLEARVDGVMALQERLPAEDAAAHVAMVAVAVEFVRVHPQLGLVEETQATAL